uniref:Uncharacterized protein n=1 Tax=viral metagenome TaxID=1070528 RepID=A0A6C0D1E6_9ZZZZ
MSYKAPIRFPIIPYNPLELLLKFNLKNKDLKALF